MQPAAPAATDLVSVYEVQQQPANHPKANPAELADLVFRHANSGKVFLRLLRECEIANVKTEQDAEFNGL